VSIRASSSKQIDTLIADLAAREEPRREAAIARLIVIGDRAVDRLIAVANGDVDATIRTAALRALEGIGSERALGVALRRIDDPDGATVRAAISLARLFLKGPKGSTVVDRLTLVALDSQRLQTVRMAAVAALRELEPKTIRPLLKKLAADSSLDLGALTEPRTAPQPVDDGSAQAAAEGVLDWLAREGAKAPLASVLGIVERVREREAAEPPGRRDAWTAVRFAAHLVLARRKSRIALYDLRESFEAAKAPLPVDALAAVTLVGDASCLEAIASAYTRSRNSAWRRQLLETFHAVVKREKLTSRHAVIRRLQKKF
jgi:HEAT repeat protein